MRLKSLNGAKGLWVILLFSVVGGCATQTKPRELLPKSPACRILAVPELWLGRGREGPLTFPSLSPQQEEELETSRADQPKAFDCAGSLFKQNGLVLNWRIKTGRNIFEQKIANVAFTRDGKWATVDCYEDHVSRYYREFNEKRALLTLQGERWVVVDSVNITWGVFH